MTDVRAVSAAVLSMLALAACNSGASDVVTQWRCHAVDAQGNAYQAIDVQAVAAMETAAATCAEGALDPASCQQPWCEPASCLGGACAPTP